VLTTLTTSFCFDFLGLEHRNDLSTADKDRRRRWVHFGFSMVLLWVIVGFKAAGTMAVIDLVFKLASFTYGPLLGLFALGLATRVRVGGPWVPVVCVASPVICWELSQHSAAWLGGYKFGTELLLLNGALTMVGLVLLARRAVRENPTK
jgi:hypothetical protein